MAIRRTVGGAKREMSIRNPDLDGLGLLILTAPRREGTA
jgi:hypothetical protein